MNEPLGIATELAERRRRIAALQSPSVRARLVPSVSVLLSDDVKRLTAENGRLVVENERLREEVARLQEALNAQLNVGRWDIKNMGRRQATNRVCAVFAKHYGISPTGVIDHVKERPYVRARDAAILFLVTRLGFNKVQTGDAIDRDHHTISVALKRAEKLYDTDSAWRTRFDDAATELMGQPVAEAA